MAAPQKLPAVIRRDGRITQPAHKTTTAISTAQMHHDSSLTGNGERKAPTNPPERQNEGRNPRRQAGPNEKAEDHPLTP